LNLALPLSRESMYFPQELIVSAGRLYSIDALFPFILAFDSKVFVCEMGCAWGVRAQANQGASERMLVCGRYGREQPGQPWRHGKAPHGSHALHVRTARQRFDGGQRVFRQLECQHAAFGCALGPFELTRHHEQQGRDFNHSK